MEEKVLLLNASFEPLRVISYRRAITLVVQDKADVIEVTDKKIRSEKQTFDLPSVIRLRNYVKIPYKAKVPLNRRTVMLRDESICQFVHCNRKASTIDHVHPRSRGGKHVWDNVVAACPKCNTKKSNKLLSEIGWELKKTPEQPAWGVWLTIGSHTREDWQPYISKTAQFV